MWRSETNEVVFQREETLQKPTSRLHFNRGANHRSNKKLRETIGADASYFPQVLPFWSNYPTQFALKWLIFKCGSEALSNKTIPQKLQWISRDICRGHVLSSGSCLLRREGFVTELLWGKMVIWKVCGPWGCCWIYKERSVSLSLCSLSPSDELIVCCLVHWLCLIVY